MARLFVAIGGLLVLALTVALVGPYFVDWTSYRADFEREAGRILGREVKVQGSATARLLPFPSVTFTDVVVAGMTPGEPAMTVETFSMDAELAPFMQGDIHIFDMRLERPSMLLDVADDGTLDWAMRPSVPLGADHVSLEKLTITEGRVTIRHAASGRTHHLTEVNAILSARSLAGPWRMEGSLRLDGMRTALSVSTGAADPVQGMRLRVRAQPERYPFTLDADGNVRIEEGRARYAGQFRLNAGATQEASAPPAYRLSGAFDFDHMALNVGEFRFETGPLDDPYIAEGSAEFSLGAEPRFMVRADGAQIRLDGGAEEEATGITLEQRLAAIREFLLDLPRPAIPGRVEVSLPAIVAGDTTVRDVHLHAEPASGGWTIASMGAMLPGRTTLEARGDLSVGDELGFSGSLLLAVGQPSGFAAWLARDVDDAIRRLPGAGFSADVVLSEERQSFSNLELRLGAAKFTGEIDSRTPPGERPSMALHLTGDALDVEGMSAFASLFVSDSGNVRLDERDLEFEIVAGPVAAAGLTAETLDTALRLKNGTLEIDRLAIGGLAGANISATGTVKDFGGEPAGTLDATIIAPDLAPLARMVAARFPESRPAAALAERSAAYPGLLDDASIHLLVASTRSGESLRAELDASGEAGGTRFSATVSTDDILPGLLEAALDLEISARNDDAAALYALAGLPALPLGLAGEGTLDLKFTGSAAGGGATQWTFSGDGLSASFEGEAAFADGGLSANGKSSIASDDLEPWMVTAGVSLPGFGLGLPVRFDAELDVSDGLVVLSGLRGEVAGNPVDGDINMQMRDGTPHLSGALSLSEFELAFIADMVVGSEAFSVAEGAVWPGAPFSAAVSAPFSADLELAVQTLRAGSFPPASEARFALRLGREGAFLSELQARALGGSLSGNVDFRNNGGTGLLSTQLRLDGADIAALPGAARLSGALDLTVSATANGKSVDGIVTALAGSGSAHLTRLSIAGVDPHALPALLQAADELGPEIDAAATRELAAERVRAGVFEAGDVDIAFTLANGSLRVPPIRLAGEGATLGVDLQADLRNWALSANSLLSYDPGAEALVGSEPAVRFEASGPLGAVEVAVDTEPLAQFLTQRALEREQQRVEAMQAGLLERQRHRREVRYYAALDEQRQAAAEEARRAAEEAERLERIQRQSDEEAERRRMEERTRLEAEEAERIRLAREVEAEEQRLAEEKLRAEVEALLRARANVPADPLADVVDTVPQPAPRGDEKPDVALPADDFSIEGIIRAIEETR